jgi:hypothetical protein
VSSIRSAKECATSLQQFYCLNASNHDLLCSTYKDGLLLTDGYDSSKQIDDVIKQYSSATISLVSINKLIPEKELKSGGYHHFVRQFGGEASPEVDESFSAIDDIPGLQVRYKMADSSDYITSPPLSVN